MPEIVTFQPNQTDAEVAGELRREMIDLLKRVCEKIDCAKSAGFVLTFVINQDAFGRATVSAVSIVKNF